ncbi:MAG TPA: hypothetical protein PKY96_10990, partial [Flavobacteriales bacterium]|nr:hypothetical protein [Flavobacteriales bacterium]
MHKPFLLLATAVIAGSVHGQFSYIVSGSPDSAQVSFNGKPKCYAPCRARYGWGEAVDKRIAIEIAAPGYEPFLDTIWRKPQNYEQFVDV